MGSFDGGACLWTPFKVKHGARHVRVLAASSPMSSDVCCGGARRGPTPTDDPVNLIIQHQNTEF